MLNGTAEPVEILEYEVITALNAMVSGKQNMKISNFYNLVNED